MGLFSNRFECSLVVVSDQSQTSSLLDADQSHQLPCGVPGHIFVFVAVKFMFGPKVGLRYLAKYLSNARVTDLCVCKNAI
jgi:hypothetical protein